MKSLANEDKNKVDDKQISIWRDDIIDVDKINNPNENIKTDFGDFAIIIDKNEIHETLEVTKEDNQLTKEDNEKELLKVEELIEETNNDDSSFNMFEENLNDFYDDLSVESYVIMPNHIHIMLFDNPLENGTPRTSSPTRQTTTVSHFVSTFKRFCNKECGKNIWQRAFHDHVIRNREDYEKHLKYIHENPMNWQLDELYTEK